MRHRKARRRLNRTSSHRLSMMRNMTTSLLEHERIVTTLPKAKEVRKYTEKMITLAKDDKLHTRRQAYRFITQKKVVRKLFERIAPRFEERNGGYTRIIKLGYRRGDAAPMAVLELVDKTTESTKKSEKKEKKKGLASRLRELRNRS